VQVIGLIQKFSINSVERMKEINQLREKLDEIDIEILELLRERIDIVKRIGLIKKRLNLPIIDENREEEVYENAAKFALKHDLDNIQIKSIFREIVSLSKKVQNELLDH
jgi:chorismate mutase